MSFLENCFIGADVETAILKMTYRRVEYTVSWLSMVEHCA